MKDETQKVQDELIYSIRERNPELNPRQIAEALAAKGVDISYKTVGRRLKKMEEQGLLIKHRVAHDPVVRDEVIERNLDTFAVQRAAIRRTERYQDVLEREINLEGTEPCECCGRYPIKADALKWQAIFKGAEALNGQVMTMAKMLGQVSDNQLILVSEMDADVAILIQEVARLDKTFARVLMARLLERSERRRQRTPDFHNLLEGEYREMPQLAPPE